MCFFFPVQGPCQGKVIFIVFLLRESRCKVQTVPLSPSYTGYKCPLVCPLEPALKEKEKELMLKDSQRLFHFAPQEVRNPDESFIMIVFELYGSLATLLFMDSSCKNSHFTQQQNI